MKKELCPTQTHKQKKEHLFVKNYYLKCLEIPGAQMRQSYAVESINIAVFVSVTKCIFTTVLCYHTSLSFES